jgi:hypothetical protein
MKSGDKTNPALLIDPNQLYQVKYTIDQSGKKHKGDTFLKGEDLTEKQIIDIIDRIEITDVLS